MKQTAQPESGHYKNLSNFKALVDFCTELGADYKPGKDALSLTALQNCAVNCRQLLTDLHSCEQALHVSVANRKAAFESLLLLAPRVVNNMTAINAQAPELKAAHHLIKKLQGRRIVPIAPIPANTADTIPLRHISAIQSSFDARLDHFNQLLLLLASEAGYVAHEPLLQLESLRSMAEGLSAQNEQVINLGNQRKLLMAKRQELLYGPADSMLARARALKQYIHAVYGSKSQQAERVQAFPVKGIR